MALSRVPDDLPPFPPPELPAAEAVRRFAAAGFLDPAPAEATWRQLATTLPAASPFLAYREETWRTLARAADPDLALRTWSRWIEGELSAGGEVRAGLWDSRPVYREGFLILAGASPALAAELEHLNEEFAPEKWQTGLATASSLAGELRPLLELPAGHGPGPDPFAVALRRFRRLADLRIAWLDECRRLAVDLVTLQISCLADALIAVALARASCEVARRLRVPAPPAGEGPPGFAVFALGKLGSLELNYSSDIDLLFLSGAPGRSGLTPELEEIYFTRLAERVIALLSDFTEGGQLYRVDTRLRPGGTASRLVWPLQAALDYYHSEGRTWERQALIRLRPAAGDLELARSFVSQIDPFIFRRTLSGEEIAELRGLKTQLERLAAERGESETHVKIGRGGIRDVEYIVQYLQLLHGAAIPELKEANLFGVLEALEKKKLLNADETDSLRRGYRFLRQVEHRIQLAYLRQTHRLPDNPADLRRIARGLGYEGSESFREVLSAHSARIRQVYRRLFESAAAPQAEEERIAAILELPLPTVAAAGREFLEPYGFREPDQALARLRQLAGEEAGPADPARLRETFRKLAPRLLRELSQYPDPDRALANFYQYVSTVGARSVFFALLLESEPALMLVLEISGRSTYAIEVLRSYPGLFDEVIDAILTGYGFDRESLLAETDRIGREEPDPVPAFFEFKYFHYLLTAFRDLDRSINLTSSMRHLAEVADAVLRATLELSRRSPGAAGADLDFLVLGLGKLGGEELNYRSDLDLVFLYRPRKETPGQDRDNDRQDGDNDRQDGDSDRGEGGAERAVAQEEAHRLAQEMLGRLAERDQLGPLYKVDVRLRPMGSKNLLAVSFEEFRRYFESGTAQSWERQAFLRARPVAGDPVLASEVREFLARRLPLASEEDPEALRASVAQMRRRLEDAAGTADFIKRGRGGIVDVEFIAQTLQLLHGREHPEVFAANTPAALDRLSKAGLLSPAVAADLLTSYQFLRWLETRLSLLMAPEESLKSMNRDRLRSLIHRIGYRSTGEVSAEEIFEEELLYHRQKNREHLERIVGRAV